MTEGVELPPSILEGLESLPEETPSALVIRHSDRPPIPPGKMGGELPLTEAGALRAQKLGGIIGPRLTRLHVSPVRRCVETAEALLEGAKSPLEPVPDRFFGEPSVFINDDTAAWKTFFSMELEDLVAVLLAGDGPPPGFAVPREAVDRLLVHLKETMGSRPGLHVFVTHDMFIMLVVSLLADRIVPFKEWPDFLEGMFFWRDGDSLAFRYRSMTGNMPW